MEVSLHDVGTMTATWNAIIDEELKHNTHRIFTAVRAVLTSCLLPLSEFV